MTAYERDRARGALLGLAAGDALGAPVENWTPEEIARRYGRVGGFVANEPAGTDDTEFTIFSGLLLARYGTALTTADVEVAWRRDILPHADGPLRGAGFSERGTVDNLRRGRHAPATAWHRHAWSDGLAMRAAPYGVYAPGDPGEAARLVATDGAVSHAGEGIVAAQAIAAAVATAMVTDATVPVPAGAPGPGARAVAGPGHPGDAPGGARADGDAAARAVVAAAVAAVPADSWTARTLRRVAEAAVRGPEAIREAAVVPDYPWTDLAPEAVALAVGAFLYAGGDVTESVLTAVNMGRDADTTAALAGALSGALHGAAAIPETWKAAIGPATGRCLPSVAGHHVTGIADLLTASPGHPTEPPEPAAEVPGPEPAAAGSGAPAGVSVSRAPHGRAAADSGGQKPDEDPAPGGEARASGVLPESGEGGGAAARPLRVRVGGAGEYARRVESVVAGLAIGDAVGWPAGRHRAAVLPAWTRRLGREVDAFGDAHGVSTAGVPFALNVPPGALGLGASDDAEWVAFAALGVLDGDPARPGDALRAAWARLADNPPDGLRARISVRAALGNLERGLAPPASGHDNPHFFDDAAAVRAVVPGVLCPGDPASAAALAGEDAHVTNDGDGVTGARAMAAAVALAVAGAGVDAAVAAALAELPPDTEIGHNARTAVDLAARARGTGPGAAFALVPELSARLVDHVYAYAVAAAETVPVALALTVAADGAFTAAVPAAACLARLADSAPALTGALTAALGHTPPDPWRETTRHLAGCALPPLAGTDLADLARRLATRAGGQGER